MANPVNARFEMKVASVPDGAALHAEVRRGLMDHPQPWLPAAWLYDDRGSELFDRICQVREYYPTRTERALLAEVAPDIARLGQATQLVELGSGQARKSHHLLEAMGAHHRPVHYVPFDVSDDTLLAASHRLLERFDHLRVSAVQGDFTRDLPSVEPTRQRRMVAFLGGTIGNFDRDEAQTFVRDVSRLLSPGDSLLLAADLVKDRRTLDAAYNDEEGLTAAFNLNALRRLTLELGARLRLEDFVHHAFFNERERRIEMHARAVRDTRVDIPRFELELSLAEGTSISTEISRKFTREELETLVTDAGLTLEQTWVADPPYALCLARRA